MSTAEHNPNRREFGTAAALFFVERTASMAVDVTAGKTRLDRVYTHAGWIRTDENSTVVVMRSNLRAGR